MHSSRPTSAVRARLKSRISGRLPASSASAGTMRRVDSTPSLRPRKRQILNSRCASSSPPAPDEQNNVTLRRRRICNDVQSPTKSLKMSNSFGVYGKITEIGGCNLQVDGVQSFQISTADSSATFDSNLPLSIRPATALEVDKSTANATKEVSPVVSYITVLNSESPVVSDFTVASGTDAVPPQNASKTDASGSSQTQISNELGAACILRSSTDDTPRPKAKQPEGEMSDTSSISNTVNPTSRRGGEDTSNRPKNKKNVRFGGIEVFRFERSQGFSTVPSTGGITIGMCERHHDFRLYTLPEFEEVTRTEQQERYHQWQQGQRGSLQISSGSSGGVDGGHQGDSVHPSDDSETTGSEGTIGDEEREATLQPMNTRGRRALLRAAGIEVDRSDGPVNHSIRQSRLNCGCSCANGVCLPETCKCSQEEIVCQVDRKGFPCSCSERTCNNPAGCIEFNMQRVQDHYKEILFRLRDEERDMDVDEESSTFLETSSDSSSSGTSSGVEFSVAGAEVEGEDKDDSDDSSVLTTEDRCATPSNEVSCKDGGLASFEEKEHIVYPVTPTYDTFKFRSFGRFRKPSERGKRPDPLDK